MRRSGLLAVVALALGVVVSLPTAAQASTAFPDVPRSDQFYGDITWLAGKGITAGNTDGTFGPTRAVSRQAMAAFLFRFANPGKDAAPACSTKPFSDVSVRNPFCGDIAWLRAHGISTGNADGSYDPLGTVTRGAMAAFMYRSVNAGATPPACSTAPFKDVPTANPFCGAVRWLVARGVTDGYADGGYHPHEAVVREAMAAFLHRLADPAPTTSAAHYVRTTDPTALRAAGQRDAAADTRARGARLHVLDIGAQSRTSPLSASSPGVLLTNTQTRLTYPALVTLLQSYLDGYQAAGGTAATVAVGTNTDGCFVTCTPASTAYPASTRGADWWTDVVAPLRSYATQNAPGLTVVGANDIEPGFAATEAQAAQWEQYFTEYASAGIPSGLQLVFNGSADGCPAGYGKTGGTCLNGWTQAELAALASGAHTQALPQIYNADQAVQWADIAKSVQGHLTFLGSLTERGVGASSSQLPGRGWIGLWNALTAAAVSPTLPNSIDLDVVD